MQFNNHSNLVGKHAFLGASKYHWINYDIQKLKDSYTSWQATQRGTELHDLACRLIKLGVKLPETEETLNMYVNDAIGFKLTPEQPLFYSYNCFGTTDGISFRKIRGKDFLRIHDLKTGITPANMNQLLIYAALFCLEYHVDPLKINIELRIYQNNEIYILNKKTQREFNISDLNTAVKDVMGKIVEFDKIIEEMKGTN